MSAGKLNFTIEQGATFSLPMTYRDSAGNLINLTGYTAALQLRRNVNSAEVVTELTDANGKIVLGGTAGTITLALTAAQTSALPAGDFSYDLKLTSGGSATRFLEGVCTVSPAVTR